MENAVSIDYATSCANVELEQGSETYNKEDPVKTSDV